LQGKARTVNAYTRRKHTNRDKTNRVILKPGQLTESINVEGPDRKEVIVTREVSMTKHKERRPGVREGRTLVREQRLE